MFDPSHVLKPIIDNDGDDDKDDDEFEDEKSGRFFPATAVKEGPRRLLLLVLPWLLGVDGTTPWADGAWAFELD